MFLYLRDDNIINITFKYIWVLLNHQDNFFVKRLYCHDDIKLQMVWETYFHKILITLYLKTFDQLVIMSRF